MKFLFCLKFIFCHIFLLLAKSAFYLWFWRSIRQFSFIRLPFLALNFAQAVLFFSSNSLSSAFECATRLDADLTRWNLSVKWHHCTFVRFFKKGENFWSFLSLAFCVRSLLKHATTKMLANNFNLVVWSRKHFCRSQPFFHVHSFSCVSIRENYLRVAPQMAFYSRAYSSWQIKQSKRECVKEKERRKTQSKNVKHINSFLKWHVKFTTA